MSKIQEFFADKTILITGATGFLGKVLLEKMLRSLPEIRRIYLLIRPRQRSSRVKTAALRFRSEVLRSSIFDRLRRDLGEGFQDYVNAKVSVVEGDLTLERLGLCDADYQRLSEEVEVLINSAATVEFDERLDLALDLNALGPLRTVGFARDCWRLQAFVHISTCYVSGNATGWSREEVRPLGFDAEQEIARLQEHCARIHSRKSKQPRDTHLQLVQLGLEYARRRGWHDTYTFTKALGEQLLVKHRGRLPMVILRPSIIESTLREPVQGWIDGFRVGDPLFVGYGQGLLRDFPGRPHSICDFVPCDYVVNAILAAAPRCAQEGGLQVYHVATGQLNPMRLGDLYRHVRDYFSRYPMTDRKGKYIEPPRWTWPDLPGYRRRLDLLHRRPLEWACDLLRPLTAIGWVHRLRNHLQGKRAEVERLMYYVNIYSPYMRIRTRFATQNTLALWNWLSPEDQKRFDFDVRRISWRDYIAKIHLPGLKRHVLNLPEDGAPVSLRLRTIREHNFWLRTNAFLEMIRLATRKVIAFAAQTWFGLEVRGVENLPRQGAFIVAANHCSHIDTGMVLTAFGERGGELFIMGARDYFFNWKAKGLFFHLFLKVVPFERTANMVEGLRLAKTLLRAQHPVLIYPEGTRSANGRLQPFKPGIGWLGVELGVPIVPCYIEGTYHALPKGKTIPRRAKTRVTFGPPITMEQYLAQRNAHIDRRELYRRIAEDVRSVVERLQRGSVLQASPDPCPDAARQ
jgi:1-acyl-sn-glycerol-3-phosphate acyltransferase